jgi:hypothetical protein
VTFADYLNYCVLRGNEIDNCVFGHTHPYRDIKRRYVFEIVYGLYDASVAALQAELRSIENELGYLRGQASVADRIFAGTELQSIEAVRVALASRRRRVAELGARASAGAKEADTDPESARLRGEVERLSQTLRELRRELRSSEDQIVDLEALVAQLNSQQARLLRASVAEEALLDFEFVVCPRCGQRLAPDRTSGAECTLCHQASPPVSQAGGLDRERDRIEEQIADTLELVALRKARATDLSELIGDAERRRVELGRDLDQVTASFVSDRQVEIASVASERSRVEAEVVKYQEFLVILERSEGVRERLVRLSEAREDARQRIEEMTATLRRGQANVRALEERFQEYVERLRIPDFDGPLTCRIARESYLPIVGGRDFDRLSSQGLQVLVNVAHALAQHTVAIDRDLPLPGLLVIDGPSSNIGTEGYDPERLADMYALFEDIARVYGHALQLIVVDSAVPREWGQHAQLTLGEEDRLVRIGHGQGSVG